MGSADVAGQPTNATEYFFFKDLDVMLKNVNAIEKLLKEGPTGTPNYALARKLANKYLEDCKQYTLISSTDLVIKCLKEFDKLDQYIF